MDPYLFLRVCEVNCLKAAIGLDSLFSDGFMVSSTNVRAPMGLGFHKLAGPPGPGG